MFNYNYFGGGCQICDNILRCNLVFGLIGHFGQLEDIDLSFSLGTEFSTCCLIFSDYVVFRILS